MVRLAALAVHGSRADSDFVTPPSEVHRSIMGMLLGPTVVDAGWLQPEHTIWQGRDSTGRAVGGHLELSEAPVSVSSEKLHV